MSEDHQGMNDNRSENSKEVSGTTIFSGIEPISATQPYSTLGFNASKLDSTSTRVRNYEPVPKQFDPDDPEENQMFVRNREQQFNRMESKDLGAFLKKEPGLRSPTKNSIFEYKSQIAQSSGLQSPVVEKHLVAEEKSEDSNGEVPKQELKSLVKRFGRKATKSTVALVGGGMLLPSRHNTSEMVAVKKLLRVADNLSFTGPTEQLSKKEFKEAKSNNSDRPNDDNSQKHLTEPQVEDALNEEITLQLKPTAFTVYDHILLSKDPVRKRDIFKMILEQLGIEGKGKKRERVQRATNGLMDCLVGLGVIRKTGFSKGLSQEFEPAKKIPEELAQHVKQRREQLKQLQAKKVQLEKNLHRAKEQLALLSKIIARNKRSSQLAVTTYGFEFKQPVSASPSNLRDSPNDQDTRNRIPLSSYIYSCRHSQIKLNPKILGQVQPVQSHQLVISSQKNIWTQPPKKVLEIFAERVDKEKTSNKDKIAS